jgi:hypothetical protein
MANPLAWVLAPALALTVVSATVRADDHTTATKNTAAPASDKMAPGAPRPAGVRSGSRPTSIIGAAWNADNTPIKSANLRLRNVVTGKVEAVTKANEAGQFTFDNVEGGNYVVELVTDTGHIQTVGNVFTIAPGETVATFVRLGPKVPWVTAFFNNTASSVASSAAAEGVSAVAPLAYCQSPPCHD